MIRTRGLLARGAMALAALLVAAGAALAGPLQLKEGEVRLDGDSTLHKFHATSKDVAVDASLNTSAMKKAGGDLGKLVKAGGVLGLKFEVPVATLKSGDESLDKNMYKALKAKDSPLIRFEMEGYELSKAEDGKELLLATGLLSIAGSSQPVKLQAAAVLGGAGLELSGTQELLMTTYGIDPPRMMLGTIRTMDKVLITFRLALGLPAGAPAMQAPKAVPKK